MAVAAWLVPYPAKNVFRVAEPDRVSRWRGVPYAAPGVPGAGGDDSVDRKPAYRCQDGGRFQGGDGVGITGRSVLGKRGRLLAPSGA